METALISSRGQFVIPASIRHAAGIKPGDSLVVSYEKAENRVIVKKKESLEEMAERLSKFTKPGIPPLEDVSGFYESRKPRV